MTVFSLFIRFVLRVLISPLIRRLAPCSSIFGLKLPSRDLFTSFKKTSISMDAGGVWLNLFLGRIPVPKPTLL